MTQQVSQPARRAKAMRRFFIVLMCWVVVVILVVLVLNYLVPRRA